MLRVYLYGITQFQLLCFMYMEQSWGHEKRNILKEVKITLLSNLHNPKMLLWLYQRMEEQSPQRCITSLHRQEELWLCPAAHIFPASYVRTKSHTRQRHVTSVNLFGEPSLMKSCSFISLQLWLRWLFVMHKYNYSDWAYTTVKLNILYNCSVIITSWWSHEAGPIYISFV